VISVKFGGEDFPADLRRNGPSFAESFKAAAKGPAFNLFEKLIKYFIGCHPFYE
jgi:hypothetical protein